MTTPNQPLPDSVETRIGTGAYEIGGGGTDFGQAVDADIVTQLFRIPNPTQANKVDVLGQALRMMPPDALGGFSEIVPDWVDGDESSPDTAADKIIAALTPRTTPEDVGNDLVQAIINMWNSWFGISSPDPAGTPEEVAQVFEAVRATVAGGYTLQTFTSSNAAWDVPEELRMAGEVYAIAVNGGGKGGHGIPLTTVSGSSPGQGGAAGVNGGYRAVTLDPSTLGATLAVTVGAASTTNGAAGGISKIVDGAVTLVESVAQGGFITSIQGNLNASTPGNGGAGGTAAPTAGAAGVSAPAPGVGGAGGSPYAGSVETAVGDAGDPGANGVYADVPISGGGGGGGGGGAATGGFAQATGGKGGNGGFPGGGSGGGGGGSGFFSLGGAAGVPANGIVAIYWR